MLVDRSVLHLRMADVIDEAVHSDRYEFGKRLDIAPAPPGCQRSCGLVSGGCNALFHGASDPHLRAVYRLSVDHFRSISERDGAVQEHAGGNADAAVFDLRALSADGKRAARDIRIDDGKKTEASEFRVRKIIGAE